VREENHVADGAAVGEEHRQAVDADADACGGRHPVGERAHVIHVHLHRLLVAPLPLPRLLLETLVLLDGVIQLRKPVRHLHPRDVQLEPLGNRRVVGRGFGEWRDYFWKINNECWLSQLYLCDKLE
jgi:hypothetical protein